MLISAPLELLAKRRNPAYEDIAHKFSSFRHFHPSITDANPIPWLVHMACVTSPEPASYYEPVCSLHGPARPDPALRVSRAPRRLHPLMAGFEGPIPAVRRIDSSPGLQKSNGRVPSPAPSPDYFPNYTSPPYLWSPNTDRTDDFPRQSIAPCPLGDPHHDRLRLGSFRSPRSGRRRGCLSNRHPPPRFSK